MEKNSLVFAPLAFCIIGLCLEETWDFGINRQGGITKNICELRSPRLKFFKKIRTVVSCASARSEDNKYVPTHSRRWKIFKECFLAGRFSFVNLLKRLQCRLQTYLLKRELTLQVIKLLEHKGSSAGKNQRGKGFVLYFHVS